MDHKTFELRSSWVHGDGELRISQGADLRITGDVSILSDVSGLGDIRIGVGQVLRLGNGAIVDLSGGGGGNCDLGCSAPGELRRGTIQVDGSLLVRDATIRSTNVAVSIACFEGASEIINAGDAEGERLARLEAHFDSTDIVADVYRHSEYEQPADSFAAIYANSYYPGRWRYAHSSAGIEIRLQPNYLMGMGVGTSHGTAYYYDRHVPIVFMGTGVTPGVSNERTSTVDIAPTLARLAGIRAPDDLDGRVVFERHRR